MNETSFIAVNKTLPPPQWRKNIAHIMDCGVLFAFMLSGLVIALAPKGLAPLLGVIGICALGHALALGYKIRMPLNAVSVSLLLFLAWAGLSVFWSIKPQQSIDKLWQLYGIALCVPLIWSYLAHMQAGQRARIRVLFLGNFLLASIIASLIVLFPNEFTRLVYGLGGVADSGNFLQLQMDSWLRVSNRSLSVLVIIGFLAASQMTTARRFILLCAAPLYFYIVWRSESQSSLMGFVMIVIFYGIAKYFYKFARAGLLVGLALVGLLIVPAAEFNYHHQLASNFMPESFKVSSSLDARSALYAAYATDIKQVPILGRGVDSSAHYAFNDLGDALGDASLKRYVSGGSVPHPHNFFLQIWFELGAIGMVLFLGFMCQLILRIGIAPSRVNRSVLTTSLACLAVPIFAFDIWQSWFLACVIFTFMVACVISDNAQKPTKSEAD